MNERINESLSALLDGEADELEIRRLLNQAEHDEQLLDKWANYQMIGAIMRQEPVVEIDLAKGVRQALDGQPMDELPVTTENVARRSWYKLAASGAVAASVMVAVLVGVQWQQQVTDDAGMPVAALATDVATQAEAAPMPVLVAQSSEQALLTAEQQQQLEDAQRRLQEYVLRHNEQDIDEAVQPMLPFMQTVKFSQEGEASR